MNPARALGLIITSVSLLVVNLDAQYLKGNRRLSGKIILNSDHSPVPNANIYISNTTIGTTSDKSGYFEISNIPFESVNLIVSCIGYKTEYHQIIFKDDYTKEITIKLESVSYTLPAVDIVDEEDTDWRDNFEIFSKEFIGTGINSEQTRIINPYIINFSESENGALIANAPVPLEIENIALGYKIICHLEKFIYAATNVKYRGEFYFENNLAKDTVIRRTQELNRLRTYAGSLRHFIKTIGKIYLRHIDLDPAEIDSAELLAENQIRLAKAGFIVNSLDRSTSSIRKAFSDEVNTNRIINTGISPNELVLVFPNFLRIEFYPNLVDPLSKYEFKSKNSLIKLENYAAYIDISSWSIDEYTIQTYGDWAANRISDMLPLDYSIPDSLLTTSERF